MLTRRETMMAGLASGLLPTALAGAVRFDRAGPGFDIAGAQGRITPILIDPRDLAGVRRAAADLAQDIGRVTGTDAALLTDPAAAAKRVIIVGSIEKSALVQDLVRRGKIDAAALRGTWEAYQITTVRNPLPGVQEALVIAGSDKRGTIYGIYDLSHRIGVSPWYWWADVPVVRRSVVRVQYGHYVQGSPAVKYRGIFLNDEAPCLSGWTTETFGGMNSKFYGKLFELMLRLRANYLWPAMWNNAFAEDDPANPILADEYGIVMGTSHHEPMARAHKEWTDRKNRLGNGEWNYATNRTAIRQFFREGIERNGDKEAVITVGMRGDGDVALASSGGLKSDIQLLETIIADQRAILTDVLHKPAASVPQVWVLFTEVLKYYEGGLQLPADVTLMFTDDNVGNLRRLPTPAERASRSGGFGVYFHMDMHGGPFSYQWINSNPLPKIWEQMNLAHEYGANQIWIANVGDLKPLELPIEFFIAMGWDPAAVSNDKIGGWTRDWAAHAFGEEHAEEVAFLVSRYAKYNAWRKPEQLRPDTFSLANYREAERVWDAWEELAVRAQALQEKLTQDRRDAYFQLVLYPVLACANLAQMYIAAARNQRFAEQARASTNAEADEVRRRFARDAALRDVYNHTMAGGKWNHMMDQTHIGYFDWYPPERDIMPPVTHIDVPNDDSFGVAVDGDARTWPGFYLPPALPQLDSLTAQPTFIDVFPRGAHPIAASVECDRPWVRIHSAKAFGTGAADRRYWIDVDWSRAPIGKSQTYVVVRDSKTSVKIKLDLVRASQTQERAARGAFGGFAPAFAIAADGFARNVTTSRAQWQAIPDFGRVATAMGIAPVTAASFDDPGQAPRLEYPVFLAEAGAYRIDLVTGPTLQVNPARPLAVAIWLDDETPLVQSVFTPEHRADQDFLGAAHAANVSANARTMSFTLRADQPGRHRLNVAMVDPTIVIQSIIVSRGDLPKSYFGPPLAKTDRAAETLLGVPRA
ncbi:glycosyl hydrolase 115 family protein [Sphingomonas sp. ASY06-1R]|uniref:glycosyl hydrolase 115 family protein n=1 Tax=Sphingomonas sp. ASY06-1R TaxID=3445771 RepID=UPI003FA27C3F